MIPESEHYDSLTSQEFRPRLIMNLSITIVMSATVQFDGHFCGRTIEIKDVAVKRMLTAKFVASKISIVQMSPKDAFSIGCLLT
jgi:hypothetical protein